MPTTQHESNGIFARCSGEHFAEHSPWSRSSKPGDGLRLVKVQNAIEIDSRGASVVPLRTDTSVADTSGRLNVRKVIAAVLCVLLVIGIAQLLVRAVEIAEARFASDMGAASDTISAPTLDASTSHISASQSGAVTVKVRAGDTFDSIAQRLDPKGDHANLTARIAVSSGGLLKEGETLIVP